MLYGEYFAEEDRKRQKADAQRQLQYQQQYAGLDRQLAFDVQNRMPGSGPQWTEQVQARQKKYAFDKAAIDAQRGQADAQRQLEMQDRTDRERNPFMGVNTNVNDGQIVTDRNGRRWRKTAVGFALEDNMAGPDPRFARPQMPSRESLFQAGQRPDQILGQRMRDETARKQRQANFDRWASGTTQGVKTDRSGQRQPFFTEGFPRRMPRPEDPEFDPAPAMSRVSTYDATGFDPYQ